MYGYFVVILFFITLLFSFSVVPERKIVIWVLGAIGTSINGLIYLYEGLKLWSEKNSRYDSRYVRHCTIVVSLSLVLFAVFVILYYLFGFYPNPPLNIDSTDLTSLH